MTQYTLPPGVTRQTNSHGRAFICVDRPELSARLSLEGAHLLSHVVDGRPLLWHSEVEPCKPGIPLRGGIPICWPWFGGDRPGPAHGIARTSVWELETIEEAGGDLYVRLTLPEERQKQHLPASEQWHLAVEFYLGECLEVRLITRNLGEMPQSLSQALHTYLPVSDIQQVSLTGLDGSRYLDQLTGTQDLQQGDVQINAEVDRIYLGNAADIQVQDAEGPGFLIQRSGSSSVVIWNPWQAKASRLSHFPEQGYRQMLCVEAANTQSDTRLLAPGEVHILGTRICHLTGK